MNDKFPHGRDEVINMDAAAAAPMLLLLFAAVQMHSFVN